MKFIIATGGTGGHLFPALQVAAELKRDGHEILFLGSFSRARELMRGSGFVFEELGTKGFLTGSFLRAIVAIAAMARGVFRAFKRLRQFKPDAVVGFGGYGAFPVVLSAFFLRRPTLIHEQNVVPGRANALLAKFANRITISFSQSARYFDPKKTVLTGCPCHLPRPSLDRTSLFRKFQLKEGKTTILVFGGSQGSRFINEGFIASARALKEHLDFQVIHLCGPQGYGELKDAYNQLGIPVALFQFLDKMEEAYHIADLVIARSGAATISEIAHFQLPAVLMPYPYARGHQKENASILCDAGVAQLLEDKDFSVSKLQEAVVKSLKLENIKSKFDHICFPDAAQRVAREALNVIT